MDEQTRRYSQTKHVASFAGFAPVENPEIACIVSIDEPVGAHHGGDVAAPVFARVVTDALRTLGVPPADEPPALVASADTHVYDIAETMQASQVAARIERDDARPALDVTSNAQAGTPARGGVEMPDLMGLSIREVLAQCAARGLKVKPSGEGVVTLQNPSHGTLVARDTVCIVKLSKQYMRKDAVARASGT